MSNLLGMNKEIIEQELKLSKKNIQNIIEKDKLFTGKVCANNINYKNDIREDLDKLPIFFILAHSSMEIFLNERKINKSTKKNDNRSRYNIERESYFIVPNSKSTTIDKDKFIYNPTPPATWAWIEDVNGFQNLKDAENDLKDFDIFSEELDEYLKLTRGVIASKYSNEDEFKNRATVILSEPDMISIFIEGKIKLIEDQLQKKLESQKW